MGNENNKVVYAPYIGKTLGVIVNGVKVWDYRWYVNILCRINWFFHFKLKKRFKKLSTTKVPTEYYQPINVVKSVYKGDENDNQ
jgi:hypothetical protein